VQFCVVSWIVSNAIGTTAKDISSEMWSFFSEGNSRSSRELFILLFKALCDEGILGGVPAELSGKRFGSEMW
jgi:hypothetical protein